MTKGPENTAAKNLPHFKQLGPCIPLKVCGNRKSPPVLPQARRTLERAGSRVHGSAPSTLPTPRSAGRRTGAAAVHTRYSQRLTGLSEALSQQTADRMPAQGSSSTLGHTPVTALDPWAPPCGQDSPLFYFVLMAEGKQIKLCLSLHRGLANRPMNPI